MLLFANMGVGVHWYFRVAVKMADNGDILSKYNTLQDILNSIIKALIVQYLWHLEILLKKNELNLLI